jgi:hypothetical protein
MHVHNNKNQNLCHNSLSLQPAPLIVQAWPIFIPVRPIHKWDTNWSTPGGADAVVVMVTAGGDFLGPVHVVKLGLGWCSDGLRVLLDYCVQFVQESRVITCL